jgi:hypothetical protein
MSAVRDTLSWRVETELAALAQRLADGRTTTRRFDRDFRRIITQAHTAALLASTAERLNMKPDALMRNPRRLSRAERNDITAAVRRQERYFDGFMRDIQAGKLSPKQIEARARLYAGAIKPFYEALRWGEWDIPDRLLPGNQECLGNCKCSISVSDNGDGTGVLTRTMGDEPHCTQCPSLAGSHAIRRKRP